jgi:hypothetical protein
VNIHKIAIDASIPGFGLTAQRNDVPDPAFSQALAAERADLDRGLIEQLPCLGVQCTVNRFQSHPPNFSPIRSASALREWGLKLSSTGWMVSAASRPRR